MTLENKTVQSYFKSFSQKKVLIIGDVMIDSYMWGKVTRISPEAPIPVVSVTGRDYRLGGAANVALNIAALGADAVLCSVIGNDEKGQVFSNLLDKKNLSCEGIIKDSSRITTVKTRIISGGQHLLRVDEEISEQLSKELELVLKEKIYTIIDNNKIDLIILEDYDKGIFSENLIYEIVSKANDKGIITTVDPKKRNFHYYKNTTLFKPNLKEFSEGIKIDINKNDIDSLKSQASKFLRENNIKMLLITLSEKGILIAGQDESYHFPAEVRDISDVSGAGDTVISVAGLLLSCGAKLSEIAQISNIAGGLVCEKTGVVPIDVDELLQETIK
jgi:rfaE bifunctional protein kinase chain/domain